MTQEKFLTKEEKKRLIRNTVLSVVAVFVVVVFLNGLTGFTEIFEKKEDPVQADFSAVDYICELATLKCYYHNVAEFEADPNGLFKYGLFKYGYKRLWMEYEGVVELGVDASEIKIEQPDEKNVVYVYMPQAKVLNVYKDETPMKIYTEKGVLTNITSEDQAQAFADAQKNMEENANADTHSLNRAHNNAQKLIENYIVNVGEQIGQQYTVKWKETKGE